MPDGVLYNFNQQMYSAWKWKAMQRKRYCYCAGYLVGLFMFFQALLLSRPSNFADFRLDSVESYTNAIILQPSCQSESCNYCNF